MITGLHHIAIIVKNIENYKSRTKEEKNHGRKALLG